MKETEKSEGDTGDKEIYGDTERSGGDTGRFPQINGHRETYRKI
jgi:hypothetical protein